MGGKKAFVQRSVTDPAYRHVPAGHGDGGVANLQRFDRHVRHPAGAGDSDQRAGAIAGSLVGRDIGAGAAIRGKMEIFAGIIAG